ncbi:MAG: right-handed parallel beta-helix repeat-containing protein, partial [Phycisphaeraceae bacterium]
GLSFAHCEWRLPDDQAGDKQAAVHVPAAVTVRGAEGVVFEDCRIEHVNTYAAEVLDGSVETTFSRCTLRDLGAGGVVIWHGCRRNAVLDCEIGPGGLVHAAACGVLIGKATGSRVIHNHIHDFYYTGVSAGWNWGYAESHGYGNVIEWNHIHDLGKELLSDMGGIYLLGHACGTRLRYNHIHDITCRRYGGWAMYTDEGSTDVLMESNLCYRTNRDPFHQHYGRNNTLRNNILAYGGHALVAYGKPEPHLGITFERNIFLSGGEPILQKWGPDKWAPEQTRFENNLYWCEDGEVRFEGGGVSVYGSQPFPDGFLAEVDRLAPLDAPEVDADGSSQPPSEPQWKQARRVASFTGASGAHAADPDQADVRLVKKGNDLWVKGRFVRPRKFESADGALWNREHIELFLRPAPDRPVVLQVGLAADGETAMQWYGCEAPADFRWDAEARDDNKTWEALLRIPLDALADVAGVDVSALDERYLIGYATPSPVGDFAAWREMGHDTESRVADPAFADPHKGDFRLPADSPAFEMGFVAWDYTKAGPRPE